MCFRQKKHRNSVTRFLGPRRSVGAPGGLVAHVVLALRSSFLCLQQRRVLGGALNHSGAAVLQVIVQVLDSSPSSHHVLSDTQLYFPLSLPKATKRGVQSAHHTETLTQEHASQIPVQAHVSLLRSEAPAGWQTPSLSAFRPCRSSLFLAPGA